LHGRGGPLLCQSTRRKALGPEILEHLVGFGQQQVDRTVTSAIQPLLRAIKIIDTPSGELIDGVAA